MKEFIESHFAILFPIFFVVIWVTVSLLISYTGGWFYLRKKFATKESFTGQKWHMQTIYLNWARYRSCATLGANSDYLYLNVMFFFKIGHPQLMIPWSEIEGKEEKSALFPNIKLSFSSMPNVTLKISKNQAEKFRMATNGSWDYTRIE